MSDSNAERIVEEVNTLKRKQPFEPFRIVTTKGEKLLIAEPDMVLVAPGRFVRVTTRSGRMIEVQKNDLVGLEELRVTKTIAGKSQPQ